MYYYCVYGILQCPHIIYIRTLNTNQILTLPLLLLFCTDAILELENKINYCNDKLRLDVFELNNI